MPEPINPATPPVTPPVVPPVAPPPAPPVELPNPQMAVDKALESKPAQASTEELPLAFAAPVSPPSSPLPIPAPTLNPPKPVSTPTPEKSEKKKTKVGVVLAGLVLTLAVLGTGVWGYYRLAETGMIAPLEEGAGFAAPKKTTTSTNTVKVSGGGEAKKETTKTASGGTSMTVKTPSGNEVKVFTSITKDDCIDPAKCGTGFERTATVIVYSPPDNTGKKVVLDAKSVVLPKNHTDNTSATVDITEVSSDGRNVTLANVKTSTQTNQVVQKQTLQTIILPGKPNERVPIGANCVSNADGVGATGSCAGGAGTCQDGKCVSILACLPGDNCPILCSSNNQMSNWQEVTEPGGGSYCDSSGRQCRRYRIERKDPGSNTHCFVKYGEICGAPDSCGGGNTFKTTVPPTDPNTPTLSCTGMTSTPTTTPAVGDKLTLTCAGAIAPSTAGTVSYDFRYSLNNGALATLTNTTATTAELTIAACGTYRVQCRACATIDGTKQCSPIWTGATQ